VASLNPSGCGLEFLKQNQIPINAKMGNIHTAHLAAVCPTPMNLQFMIDNKLDIFHQ
jgi:hypothetical protein